VAMSDLNVNFVFFARQPNGQEPLIIPCQPAGLTDRSCHENLDRFHGISVLPSTGGDITVAVIS